MTKRLVVSPLVALSLGILTISTIFWAYFGAAVQSSNADQIVNSYLIENRGTFEQALIPGTHTFLIKWPLFVLVQLFGHTSTALTLITILSCVFTIGTLAYVIYRIEKRPVRLSILILLLSSILLFIPAQPHDGALLPANFAMLTTRNIEYVVYIVGLILLLRAPKRIYSWQLLASVALLSLLAASDKLFLGLSFGGAFIMFVAYRLFGKNAALSWKINLWLLVSLASSLLATALLWLIDSSRITQIVGQTNASPYQFVTDIHHLILAFIFTISGIMTNFGANPVFDIGVVKEIPRIFASRLLDSATIGFAVNSLTLIASSVAAVHLIRRSLRSSHNQPIRNTTANSLSLMLLASSIVAVALFITTEHYYPADSRYLTIIFFALFISLASYQRQLPDITPRLSRYIIGCTLVAICSGMLWTYSIASQQLNALQPIVDRNAQVVAIMKKHNVDILIGDYWRVLPIRNTSRDIVHTTIPLASCLTPRDTLTSKAWESDLRTHSFAYLLSLDKSLAEYGSCTIEQVVGRYGQPNASSVVAGTNDHPRELLLFYDHGVSKNDNQPKRQSAYTTIFPVTLPQSVPSGTCADNTTILNIVAHQDDDLLFMNPTIAHAIAAGSCVRTVYLTAGDAGQDERYWIGRERATREAYTSLMGASRDTLWVQKRIKVHDNGYITSLTPSDDQRISLLFMRLPDGNLLGEGFMPFAYQSLENLIQDRIPAIHSVDQKSHYSSDELIETLSQLMTTYHPSIINTQAPIDTGHHFHDHSDHITTGRYAQRAYNTYIASKNNNVPMINYFIGYPVRERPINVFGDDLTHKLAAFTEYSHYDDSVCQSIEQCAQTPTYWSYLHREYTTN